MYKRVWLAGADRCRAAAAEWPLSLLYRSAVNPPADSSGWRPLLQTPDEMAYALFFPCLPACSRSAQLCPGQRCALHHFCFKCHKGKEADIAVKKVWSGSKRAQFGPVNSVHTVPLPPPRVAAPQSEPTQSAAHPGRHEPKYPCRMPHPALPGTLQARRRRRQVGRAGGWRGNGRASGESRRRVQQAVAENCCLAGGGDAGATQPPPSPSQFPCCCQSCLPLA